MKTSLGLVALATTIFLSGSLKAQGIDEFGRYGPRGDKRESKQVGALEVRIGRYKPSVDQEFGGTGPYERMFGTNNRYSFGLEGDWQVLRIPYLGTLGPGVGIEYTTMSAKSFVASNPGQRSGENTSLSILPIYAVAVLRADYIAKNTVVPFVPYAKAGLGSALWWVSNGGGTASYQGVSGRGFSYGPQFALGGMLLLDFLDRSSAAYMDDSLGINHSYFFGEWFFSSLNGFGSSKQMQVGTSTWVLGLAFEF